MLAVSAGGRYGLPRLFRLFDRCRSHHITHLRRRERVSLISNGVCHGGLKQGKREGEDSYLTPSIRGPNLLQIKLHGGLRSNQIVILTCT